MIKIVQNKEKTEKVNDPYYCLTYNYMIGDADGNTTEECQVSLKNPFLERYVTLLNKLEPTKGHWGIVFDGESILDDFLTEGQINDDDYHFLSRLMFEDSESEYPISPENEEYANEFYEGVRGDTEYSFLVFEGVDITYIDEYGVEHNTEIV